MASSWKRFGQKRPPLSVTIKGILERYPDGQIFKEMIQNADDAGAETVWFYVDERQHGTSNLLHPDLVKFQGPALVAANDACFTDKDWEGIQSLQQSVKADDPFKVGRFGIGFNSVYHITDVPLIVSGSEVGFLDPEEKIWSGDSGRQFNLAQLANSSITAALEGLANFQQNQGSNYPHTIFRLPLRTSRSGISDNIYSVEKVKRLLDALRKEAKYLLLFLKSVNKIEVIYVDHDGHHTPSFCVSIDPRSIATLKQERVNLLDQLHKVHRAQSHQASYSIQFTTFFNVIIKDRGQVSTSQWLVANRVGSGDTGVLAAADELHIFPWVGVALELATQLGSGGRVFCFLPLPTDVSSGLPVHVNGTFSLNDERRTLKWTTLERENDKMANWNHTLVGRILPECYFLLILKAMKHLSWEQVYCAWPNVEKPQTSNWGHLLTSLFKLLFQQECVWSVASNRWVRIPTAIFVEQDKHLADVVKRVLKACELSVVVAPGVVWNALKYCKKTVQSVTPSIARREMRVKKAAYESENFTNKLELLRFCLSDRKYSDLHNLVLIPLVSGKFVSFVSTKIQSAQSVKARYVCSEDFPRDILPNLDNYLICIRDDDSLQTTLLELAGTRQTQMRPLSVQKVAELLPFCFPKEWDHKDTVSLPCSSFPIGWFERFWRWVGKHDLSHFTGLPVLPLATQHPKHGFRVTKLNPVSSSKVILISESSQNDELSALCKLNVQCTVSEYIPYVNHFQLFSYVHKLTNPIGILTAVGNANRVLSNIQSISLQLAEAKCLQKLLAGRITSLNQLQRGVLRNLSIFETLNNSELLSVNGAMTVSWKNQPVLEPYGFELAAANLPDNLVVFSRRNNDISLFDCCGNTISKPTNLTEFIQTTVFPMISDLSYPNVDAIMEEILQLLPVLKRQMYSGVSITVYINQLPFLQTKSGTRKSPAVLFDPTVKEVKHLYQGEDVFPLSPFSEDEKYLRPLRECGLRSSIGSQEIVSIFTSLAVKKSSSPKKVSETSFSRVEALLEYISAYPSLCSELVGYQRLDHTLRDIASRLNCLPVTKASPGKYPRALSWKGQQCTHHLASFSEKVCVCQNVCFHKTASLVGSQAYIVQIPATLSSVMVTPIPLKTVLDHFRHIMSMKEKMDAMTISSIVYHVYKYLTDNLQQLKSDQYLSLDLCLKEWIWLKKEKKFVKPSVLALEVHPSFERTLEPYVFILPEELHQYYPLFMEFGMSKTLSTSQIVSVLEKIRHDKREVSSTKQWSIIHDILNWLTNRGQTLASEKLTTSDMLYVPVDSLSKIPELVDAREAVYTDMQYLKSFHASKDKELKFIHNDISHLARSLGVKGLSNLLNISQDAFGDVGPHEPLVTRLKNILRDYKDGLTIVKELLQNADDAEATEVNICYDTRSHQTDSSTLLFPGMAKCHGPALLVHNNSVFSDEDFTNITKLAGATKGDKHLKIGKFGIGFCSVYHITDIPSFVSRDWLYIFDPTVGYLREEIKDKSRPGKKLHILEEVVGHSQQLDPYLDLFNFKRNKSYNGTLFRFPFRTSNSNLSSIQYDRSLVEQLLKDINTAGSKLLLFLQNVKRITFSRVDHDQRGETKFKQLLEIRKESLRTITPSGSCVSDSTNSAKELSVTVVEHGSLSTQEKWLLASSNDTLVSSNCRKFGTSSIACRLMADADKSSYQLPSAVQGEIFCFLPLSLKSGLPVHVSSNFAVMNDRTGIHSSDQHHLSRSSQAQWNEDLMKTVIPNCYHTLLLAAQTLCKQGSVKAKEYNFTSLWPLSKSLKIKNPWVQLIQHVYQLITDSHLFHSSIVNKWLRLKDIKILSTEILCSGQTATTPECVVDVMKSLNYPLVSLAPEYQYHLSLNCVISEEEFLKIFFLNIKQLKVSTETRNTILFLLLLSFAESETRSLFLLKKSIKEYLKPFLIKHRCIPCKPTGVTLKHCYEVLDSTAPFADLYNVNDEMFPIDRYSSNVVKVAMKTLGMITTSLPWNMLIERAKTVKILHEKNKEEALNRAAIILQCIDKNVQALNPQLPTEAVEITKIPFLPVMDRPKKYPEFLVWSGDNHCMLSSRDMLRGEKNSRLAGSQASIVCENAPKLGGCFKIPHNAMIALDIKNKPRCSLVVNHLLNLACKFTEQEHESVHAKQKWLEEACSEIFKFFEAELGIGSSVLKDLLLTKCLWTGERFIAPRSVAIKWNLNGPILYKVPSILEGKEKVLKALEIQSEFRIDQLLLALRRLRDNHNTDPIRQNELKLVSAIVGALDDCLQDTNLNSDCVCYLPDEKSVMRSTDTLAYNDAQWCKVESECYFVHYSIPRPVALKLHVKLVRTKALEAYESGEQHFTGVEFGQHEELTQRIQNILSEYPFDITVIKELLQNADDAKAKKLYIILDKRTHGTNKIPSSRWKDLQGPALIVWNDRGFLEDDLRGIQRLGLGSKRSKSEAIGQYGIGFNVVYHLTDCPSFLTNGDTLCVLDPHIRYVPGANEVKPGRMYQNLDESFWNNWSDLKAPYLRECLQDCPSEIQETGSLFRFPLRHSQELVTQSKLLEQPSSVLSAWKMKKYLDNWAPKMKDALIFLNNVTELKFFVIAEHARESKMELVFNYTVELEQEALVKRVEIQNKAAQFAVGADNIPTCVSYPLILSEKSPSKLTEEWLIQRGIGDSMNPKQHWEYLKQIKPNHGLATPIHRSHFRGNVFCFLPLPMTSNLPVHVNGNFILDAARSGMWRSRDTKEEDDKSRWNARLIEAIGSSYAEFIVMCQSSYIGDSPSSGKKKVLSDSNSYYGVFPKWDPKSSHSQDPLAVEVMRTEETPEGAMKTLAEITYKKLYEKNSSVHIVIKKTDKQMSGSSSKQSSRGKSQPVFSIEWHPLMNKEQPSKQVFFWSPTEEVTKTVAPVLKRVGMHLSIAPITIRRHFRNVGHDLPEAIPKSVFEYYQAFYKQAVVNGTIPCNIEDTSFVCIDDFKIFSAYLLGKKDEVNSEFPGEPFGIPLLVTADRKLRCFNQEKKVMHTSQDYSSLFHNSSDKFLHPLLLDLKYSKCYFLEPSEDNLETVLNILTLAIPSSLHDVRMVKDATRHFEPKKLKLLWSCFVEEQVFSMHLTSIVKRWAIILSTDNKLFACRTPDQLLPVIPPRKPGTSSELYSLFHPQNNEEERFDFEIYELLSKHGMPVVNIEVCNLVQCKRFCPQYSQPKRILSNLYHLHQSDTTSSLYTSSVLKVNIRKLLRYLAQIHFSQDETSLSRVKSLPLFCDIGSCYRPLLGEVFLWPGIGCMAGSKKWLHLHTTVFLEENGTWKELANAEVLQIKRISPLILYTRFIFPSFAILSQEERLEHLAHIRDTKDLFTTAYRDCKSEEMNGTNQKKEAALFVAALQQLPCLPIDGVLKPLCDFCDPQAKIFELFPENFHFPSQELCCDEWLVFFRKIGLKTKPTKKEYISFCEKVSLGNHKDILGASKVLIENLCSNEDWHNDSDFLKQVSNIPFVCAHNLPRLAWIRPICPAKSVIQKGKKSFALTTLQGSVSYNSSRSKAVWTVRSAVVLPRLPYPDKERIDKFLADIGVSLNPTPSDVMQNVCNIAQTKFAHFKLFEQYPENLKAPKRGYSLLDVVHENLMLLSKCELSPDVYNKLRNIPCIPVSQDGQVAEIVKPVLVKPINVVAIHPETIKQFWPILNPLPDLFFDILRFLSEIGIKNTIYLEQVQYAFETIKAHIQEPYDPRTCITIQLLLKHLYDLLPSKTSETAVSVLKHPLYLPNKFGLLVDSKTLLFDDVGYRRGTSFDFSGLQFSFMSLLVKQEEELNEYDFRAKDLHLKLPKHVQPFPLSTCCTTQLHENCSPSSEDNQSQLSLKLRKAFKLPQFADVVMKILQTEGNKKEVCSAFSSHLGEFVKRLEVVTINSLKVDITLALVEPPVKIGTAVVDFHKQVNNENHTLYLDATTNPLKLDLIENISMCVVNSVVKMISTDMTLHEPGKVIGMVLRAEDAQQLQDLLTSLGIKTSELKLQDSIEDSFHPKVGDPIPESWHHRLQSDINNYFRPQEMAGLEVAEEQYIYIRVEHLMPSPKKQNESISSGSEDEDEEEVYELDEYTIWVDEDDEGTKVVSVIDLFKILSIKEITQDDDGSTDLILYNPESEGVKAWNSVKGDKLKDLMKEICVELRRIWKLKDKDQKRKAIKAMYLKWHPDKNPNPLATKAFQFLQSQISRLERGLPLEDPSEDWEPQSHTYPSSWDFDWWDVIVRTRRDTWNQERSRRDSGVGGGVPDWTWTVRVHPKPQTAKVWFEQAEYDFAALRFLSKELDETPEMSAHVCFLACQVAEKSIKAGMYQVCGLQQEGLVHHKFIGYAGALEQERRTITPGLQALTRVLENYYVRTRYPNAYTPPCTPSSKFGPSDAREAEMIASQILDMMRKIVYE